MTRLLSDVRGQGNVSIGNLQDHPSDIDPDLALAAMKVISGWALCDSFFEQAFIAIAGQNAEVAASLYGIFRNTSSQESAIKAVAEISLAEDKKPYLNALLKLRSRIAARRNLIAHGIWGFCSTTPGCLLLVTTRDIDGYYLKVIARPDELPKLPEDKIQVWDKADFVELITELDHLNTLVGTFRTLVLVPNAGNGWELLGAEPEIVAELRPRR